MDVLETIEYKGYEIKIYQDKCDESPRDWDNLGTMACFHPRHNLGDEHDFAEPKELEEFLGNRKDIIALPLYLYEHSGFLMNTSGFFSPWDSGQVGIIFVEYETLRRKNGWKNITRRRRALSTAALEQEVKTYNQYLRGDVYGYSVENENDEIQDSCWGFFGDWDKGGLLDEAKLNIDFFAAQKLQEEANLARRLIAATSAA